MVNVHVNMNPEQVAMCAEMIVSEKWMYSLEDIVICLNRGACGLYGKIDYKLDASVIFSWFVAYELQRQEVIREKKKREIETNNIYEVFQNPVMQEAMHTVVDKMKLRDQEIPKTEAPVRELSPFEKMVILEWDAMKYGENERIRLKKYKEIWCDFTDYRSIRASEEIEKQNSI